jgi:hypothetical protein
MATFKSETFLDALAVAMDATTFILLCASLCIILLPITPNEVPRWNMHTRLVAQTLL